LEKTQFSKISKNIRKKSQKQFFPNPKKHPKKNNLSGFLDKNKKNDT
jgi:hypothetical protein